MVINLLKTSYDKEIILRADKDKRNMIYRGTKKGKDYSSCLVRNNARLKRVNNIFKVLKLSIYNSTPIENTF